MGCSRSQAGIGRAFARSGEGIATLGSLWEAMLLLMLLAAGPAIGRKRRHDGSNAQLNYTADRTRQNNVTVEQAVDGS